MFGTDGIRGAFDDSIHPAERLDALQRRIISPGLAWAVGWSLARLTPAQGLIVIGWDDRPGNPAMVRALSDGCEAGGAQVIHLGICATPAVQHGTLLHEARFGCMVTASHNPRSDTGIKVFDDLGRKSQPSLEREITSLVQRAPSRKDSAEGWQHIPLDHAALVRSRVNRLTGDWDLKHVDPTTLIPSQGLIVDGSGSAVTPYVTQLLDDTLGIEAVECGASRGGLNVDCGAGAFSPTDTWSWEELQEPQAHALLDAVRTRLLDLVQDPRDEWPEGTLLGASVDGDADRCLLFESTGTGLRVVDGDQIGDRILRATSGSGPWTLAASIESDLGMIEGTTRFSAGIETRTTAVGDRWLSHALLQGHGSFLMGAHAPKMIGIEDSGHVVLPSPHPRVKGAWTLVGDGLVTLCMALIASAGAMKGPGQFLAGFKRRVSIKGTDRSRWTGDNAIAEAVLEALRSNPHLPVGPLEHRAIEGGGDLLLVEAELRSGGRLSLGVRNSGTEAKTSISLRTSVPLGEQERSALAFMESIRIILEQALIP